MHYQCWVNRGIVLEQNPVPPFGWNWTQGTHIISDASKPSHRTLQWQFQLHLWIHGFSFASLLFSLAHLYFFTPCSATSAQHHMQIQDSSWLSLREAIAFARSVPYQCKHLSSKLFLKSEQSQWHLGTKLFFHLQIFHRNHVNRQPSQIKCFWYKPCASDNHSALIECGRMQMINVCTSTAFPKMLNPHEGSSFI